MHVVFCRHARRFVRLLEERPDIDVKPEIGIGGGDHFCATVVTILAHLGDKNARMASVLLGEFVG